jgi:hypothetical protein
MHGGQGSRGGRRSAASTAGSRRSGGRRLEDQQGARECPWRWHDLDHGELGEQQPDHQGEIAGGDHGRRGGPATQARRAAPARNDLRDKETLIGHGDLRFCDEVGGRPGAAPGRPVRAMPGS